MMKIRSDLRKLKKYMKKDGIMEESEKIARYVYRQYSIEERNNRNCGKLLLEWVSESFWGIVVGKHISVFEKVWKILDKKRYTKKNKFIYGDIDVGLWVEYPKSENKKVIVSTCYCSCADDNTHIFILEKNSWNWVKFRVNTVWPRENNKGGYMTKNGWFYWGDDRDIKTPSLNTYRKRDFEYGYNDCRDKGCCISYNNLEYGQRNGRVEGAYYREGKIEHALCVLRGHLEALKEKQ